MGAEVANMEFVQFHPTGLYLENGEPARGATPVRGSGGEVRDGGGPPRTFLISEALRGEGAILRNLAGERFMRAADARAELAPRDVVARAIHSQIVSGGDPHVWLDISHLPSDKVLRSFPAIAAHCLTQGIDITSEPIPVAPTQHYFCGGVKTGISGKHPSLASSPAVRWPARVCTELTGLQATLCSKDLYSGTALRTPPQGMPRNRMLKLRWLARLRENVPGWFAPTSLSSRCSAVYRTTCTRPCGRTPALCVHLRVCRTPGCSLTPCPLNLAEPLPVTRYPWKP